MPTLYDYPRAPSPRRARMVLAEKGIAHDTVVIDLGQAEQLSDAYRAINPGCTVPALKLDDGTVLTDNAAIVAWAEAAHPDPSLTGTTPVEKAKVASWTAKIEQDGLSAIAEAFRNTAEPMKGRALTGPVNYDQIPALAERGKARVAAFMDNLNRQLEGRDFVAIDRFSLADIAAIATVDFARVIGFKPGDDHPNVVRWRTAMAERPSVSL